VDRDLQEYRRAARVLSSKRQRLLERYPRLWVGVYRGKVVAKAKTLPTLMAQLDEREIPRRHVIVRFIDKNRRTMVL